MLRAEERGKSVSRDIDLDAVSSDFHTAYQGRNHSSIFLWRLFKLLCNLTPALNQMALSVAADARALDRIEQFRSAGEQP